MTININKKILLQKKNNYNKIKRNLLLTEKYKIKKNVIEC